MLPSLERKGTGIRSWAAKDQKCRYLFAKIPFEEPDMPHGEVLSQKKKVGGDSSCLMDQLIATDWRTAQGIGGWSSLEPRGEKLSP